MNDQYTDAEIEAFLDEALDPARASEIEELARKDSELLKRMSMINRRRDAGVHSMGAIWRRYQIGVPGREVMGQFLLGILDSGHADYIRFRLEVLKCPYTLAMRNDLEGATNHEEVVRTKDRCDSIYQSSAGLLGKKPGNR